jgi:hypothetical protein
MYWLMDLCFGSVGCLNATRVIQEFEERRRQLDDIKDSRVNESVALSAVEAFFERDSPSRSPKHKAQSPTVSVPWTMPGHRATHWH